MFNLYSHANAEMVIFKLTFFLLCLFVAKKIFFWVMPPLHAEDVQQRPEVGEKMRNKLVKVMIGKVHISQLAAHLFFILCKRSVNRFNKYCGFGNAAGLLANYGLLGEINTPKNPNDSEDSETDDYKEVEVTGYIEPNREDPLKNMTDEQKEYEAMKLVNAMKNLMDKGVIAPARTDENGKLCPVEHILELKKSDEKASESSDNDNVG
uniref:Synembryn-A n=1 Tax=Syphacia muris TaxID=451379 RepID=A0A0N5AVQ7_9BILA